MTRFFHVRETFQTSKTRTGLLIYNRMFFRKHYRKWEYGDSEGFTDNCNEMFYSLSDEQYGEEDSGGSQAAVKHRRKHGLQTNEFRHGHARRNQGR